MPTKLKPKPGPVDPAQVHNEKILRERQERIDAQKIEQTGPPLAEYGIELQPPPEPQTAVEFFRDEFDRKNFGEPRWTTRTVYGPDPLLGIPYFKQQIEELGLEEFAAIVYQTIMEKEEMAIPDPFLRKRLRQAINHPKFGGKTAVAAAFRDRILQIPSKTVQVEVDTGDDDEVLGHPLEDAVRRYLDPGMSPKFLSERCMALLGKRGYQIRMDEHGDPVKVGTLIMGQIPKAVAERRQQKVIEESNEAVAHADENYMAAQERFLQHTADRPMQRHGGTGFLPSGTPLAGNASDIKDVTTGLVFEEDPT